MKLLFLLILISCFTIIDIYDDSWNLRNKKNYAINVCQKEHFFCYLIINHMDFSRKKNPKKKGKNLKELSALPEKHIQFPTTTNLCEINMKKKNYHN
jgi:hypothetical protein